MPVDLRQWAVLLALVVIWGSSYLMVEVALRVWHPAEIVGLRITIGAFVLFAVLLGSGRRMPRKLANWGWFLAIAVIGNCMPFGLIAWGQQGVESGLAGILAAVTPLCVLVMAHFTLPDERLSARYLAGFLLGFAGVVVLIGPDSLAAIGGNAERLLSQTAILGGAVCYALATVLARRMPTSHPVVTSAAVMLLAAGVMAPFTASAGPGGASLTWQAAAAVGFLGLLGTGVASVLYFYLVDTTSARFVSLLNYLVPVWAVLLGSLSLGEHLALNVWLALGLVLAGLAMTHYAG